MHRMCGISREAWIPVGWGDAGTPTVTPGVDLCWGSYLTPTYDTIYMGTPPNDLKITGTTH